MDLSKYEKLVHKFARKWYGITQEDNLLSYDDLVQEGWIALSRAANKFNEIGNSKFITYAYIALDNAYKDLYKHYQKDREIGYLNIPIDEEGNEIEIEDKNSDFIPEVETNDFLSRLSEKAQRVANYILEDTKVDKIDGLEDVVKYWKHLEYKFGKVTSIKEEIQGVLLG